MISRKTLLLKPMQAAASGYARLHTENGYTQIQLHARGLPAGQTKLFIRTGTNAVREAAHADTNAHGEASMELETTETPELLLVIGTPPKPLLIGLCQKQDAGSLLDAKNTALALCERLMPIKKEPMPPKEPPVSAIQPAAVHPGKPAFPKPDTLPREIFLPAIDPAPYTAAALKEEAESILPPPQPSGPPADRLRPLKWPRGFAAVKPHFECNMPIRLFDWPGWRFVQAAQGLFIGRMVLDGRVHSVAYAYDGEPPQGAQRRYQPVTGVDGRRYQVLKMEMG